ncbi:uncharacterized protein LOC108899242 [Lates calcarifer]|uniref:Uncharacterized protein LOC108899242 n=1 Tax=Lates calcarifer TaxID=8187 RepID=A0AAJ7VI62_LATCA|nr:uncharacterized protein LOC108899242 [Lates calcarifer]
MQSDRSRQQVPEILEREEMSSTSSTTAELLSPQRAPLNISEANNSSSELDKDSHLHPLSPQPRDATHSSEGSRIMGRKRSSQKRKSSEENNSGKYFKYSEREIENCIFWHRFTKHINSIVFHHENISQIFSLVTKTKKLNTKLLLAVEKLYPIQTSTKNLEYVSSALKSEEVKKRWDEMTKQNQTEIFNKEMEHYSALKNELVDKAEHVPFEKQFAFAIVVMEDECRIFPVVFPQHKHETPNLDITQHSEEILIGQLDEFFPQNRIKLKSVFMYTYHSPCLERTGNTECCMFKLLDKANEWNEKYGTLLYVAFTKLWGLNDPNYLKKQKSTNKSDPCSDFYQLLIQKYKRRALQIGHYKF